MFVALFSVSRVALIATLLIWMLPCLRVQAESPISQLRVQVRHGQIFLMWSEAPTADTTTFNVYVDDRPIEKVADARLAAHHIENGSGRDWWQDPSSFKKGEAAVAPVGFKILDGSEPFDRDRRSTVDPTGGLFVYSVPIDAMEAYYFAVTRTVNGNEEKKVELGVNSLSDPVVGAVHRAIQPIWQKPSDRPGEATARGKPLAISLHGKGGVVADMEYLAFGDDSMGWRAGLPFKFSVRIEEDMVVVRPTDRVWINRPHREASDGGTPAIWSFWYGYNSHIYDREAMATGTPTNYTERRLLWIIRWVEQHYGTDPKRRYLSGSSMGGCGTVSFGLRHPELFAALHARVPIVSYTYLGTASAKRLEPSCWIGPITSEVRTQDGQSLLERMNGARLAAEAIVDLPPISMVHGRQDGSIPWINNPAFYRAMQQARQSIAVYWDDGIHSTAGDRAPIDVQDWPNEMFRYRLDESYPVFTKASTDKDPGDGRSDDGDIVGWIQRGLDWSNIIDEQDRYSIVLSADCLDATYPVTTDVSLRRRQNFRTQPGEKLVVTIGDQDPKSVHADEHGLVTLTDVAIPSADGVSVSIRRE